VRSMEGSKVSPERGATVVDLAVGGWPLDGVHVLRADAFLAADRPDRLEVCLLSAGRDAPRPGERLVARRGGEVLFEGLIERVAFELDRARGRILSVVAYADYHRLRPLWRPTVFYQTTDSEVAGAIAACLELVAVVEPAEAPRSRLVPDGDPLVFLRRRARSCGFELAVTGGGLYFLREPPPAREPAVMRGLGDLIAVGVTDRGKRRGGRGGTVDLLGDPRWKPLSSVVLAGIDPVANGTYHVVRVLHRMDPSGYKTTLEILEEGLDYPLWQHGAEGDEEKNAG